MSEINNNSTEKIAIEPEEIGSTTEKIDENSEKITSETEKIPEIIPEKKKSKGERGPDKNKRRFNPDSLKNLMQYKNNFVEEKKPIWKKPVFWLGVGGTILAFSFLALKLYEIMDKSRQEDSEKSEDEIKQLEE